MILTYGRSKLLFDLPLYCIDDDSKLSICLIENKVLYATYTTQNWIATFWSSTVIFFKAQVGFVRRWNIIALGTNYIACGLSLCDQYTYIQKQTAHGLHLQTLFPFLLCYVAQAIPTPIVRSNLTSLHKMKLDNY